MLNTPIKKFHPIILFPRIKGFCEECKYPLLAGGEHKHYETMDTFCLRINSQATEEEWIAYLEGCLQIGDHKITCKP